MKSTLRDRLRGGATAAATIAALIGVSSTALARPDIETGFYLYQYHDLVQAFGPHGHAAASQHWEIQGIHEGRRGSPTFDPAVYLMINPDLQAAFGNNYAAARNHYLTFGIHEGRIASLAFDPRFYLAKYNDLRAAFGDRNYLAALNHYIQFGMAEGRQGSDYFDVKAYLNNRPDLIAVFGANNYIWALYHWYRFSRVSNVPPPTSNGLWGFLVDYAAGKILDMVLDMGGPPDKGVKGTEGESGTSGGGGSGGSTNGGSSTSGARSGGCSPCITQIP